MKSKHIIFVLLTFFFFKNVHSQTNTDTTLYQGYLVEPVEPFVPGLPNESLLLSSLIEGYCFQGLIYCNILIDTAERRVVSSEIFALRIKNCLGGDIINCYKSSCDKYFVEISLMKPFVESYIEKVVIFRNKHGNKEKFGRYYYYSIVIRIE